MLGVAFVLDSGLTHLYMPPLAGPLEGMGSEVVLLRTLGAVTHADKSSGLYTTYTIPTSSLTIDNRYSSFTTTTLLRSRFLRRLAYVAVVEFEGSADVFEFSILFKGVVDTWGYSGSSVLVALR